MSHKINSNDSFNFIAHVRETDQCQQSLEEHLHNVGELSAINAKKIDLELPAQLIGLLHDLGKYSSKFQNYLKSGTGLINQDEDEYVDSKELKGKIDHSTAGAQFLWNKVATKSVIEKIVSQILSLCIASHHSGLIDCLAVELERCGENNFSKRMQKAYEKTHLTEVIKKLDQKIRNQIEGIFQKKELTESIIHKIEKIKIIESEKHGTSLIAHNKIGLLTKVLFSCLVDADRIDTADFERPSYLLNRQYGKYMSWERLIELLEVRLKKFISKNTVDYLRSDISDHCLKASSRDKDTFTLSVPTGGGKTLASLRFAMHHANLHKLDRIIYVIPFTSIIDQNANTIREILEPNEYPDLIGKVVLEHHSNITPGKQTWKEKILTQNWDAPVIFITNVLFLETLFGSGTTNIRRLHQLINSVIIFDEVQTLPVRCVHLFNNAINFLVEHGGSSVVLCTATQPLLHQVDLKKGSIRLSKQSEIVPDVSDLFEKLKRVDVFDKTRTEAWTEDEIVRFAISLVNSYSSCLLIVNTKKHAQSIFQKAEVVLESSINLFHLSTNMCPAHRKLILSSIKEKLESNEKILCISTQMTLPAASSGVSKEFKTI
jgi:CRISPR-associated endonuclease/helicase Cas3